MTGTRSLLLIGHEWLNTKIDLLSGKRSPGEQRIFVMSPSRLIHDDFVSRLTKCSEEAYRLFGCTYGEMNDLILDYKLCRDNVLNATQSPWTPMRRWELVYPNAFIGLYEITNVDILDSIDEVLTNILSGVLQTRRIIVP